MHKNSLASFVFQLFQSINIACLKLSKYIYQTRLHCDEQFLEVNFFLKVNNYFIQTLTFCEALKYDETFIMVRQITDIHKSWIKALELFVKLVRKE